LFCCVILFLLCCACWGETRERLFFAQLSPNPDRHPKKQIQTRGWFYTLMVLSTALFDKPAFKNLVCNGLVLAADGKKMSKRLKNYPVRVRGFLRVGCVVVCWEGAGGGCGVWGGCGDDDDGDAMWGWRGAAAAAAARVWQTRRERAQQHAKHTTLATHTRGGGPGALRVRAKQSKAKDERQGQRWRPPQKGRPSLPPLSLAVPTNQPWLCCGLGVFPGPPPRAGFKRIYLFA
jgi:hypothetical protein